MEGSALVHRRADWVRFLEAVYEPASDDLSWGRGVVDSMRRVFRCSDGVNMHAVEHDPECRDARVLLTLATGAAGDLAKLSTSYVMSLGPVAFRAIWYPPAMVTTISEMLPLLARDVREVMQAHAGAAGVQESVAIVVHPEPGVAIVLSCVQDRLTTPTRHERLLLSRAGLHLESAYRLRRRPELVKAVLTLSGTRAQRTADAPGAEILAERARAIEVSLTKKGRQRPEDALELWTALLAGRYSLVPRTENGARRYLVLENAPHSHAMRALSQRELDVLSMAARGLSTKLVSYGLGLSPATVSSALARAASKLGLASHLELLRLAATISHDPRSRALPATLTAAETEVLSLLREGLSNQEIARIRSRSHRTIANQVASLLRKTDSASRRVLVAEASSAALGPPPGATGA